MTDLSYDPTDYKSADYQIEDRADDMRTAERDGGK